MCTYTHSLVLHVHIKAGTKPVLLPSKVPLLKLTNIRTFVVSAKIIWLLNCLHKNHNYLDTELNYNYVIQLN